MKIGYGTVRNLLATGVVFLPFTSLRFGPVGIGELALVAALFLLLVMNRWKLAPLQATMPLLVFWTAYPLWIILGFSYNLFFLGYSSGDIVFAAFDQISYLFVLVLVIVLGDRNLYDGEAPDVFFERVFFYWAVTFSVLFALSQVTSSIAGFPLLYYTYFSPLVVNVHQAAMITSAMPYVMFFLAFRATSIKWTVIYFAFAALFIPMALDSGSTKAWLATLIGALASVGAFIAHRPTGRGRVRINIISYLLVATALLVIVERFWSLIVAVGVEFFREEDGGSAREDLYSYGFSHAMQSPFFGYGPGPHIADGGGFSDAHNTALTILLQGGLVAAIMFVILLASILGRASMSGALIGTIVAISIYALGGDILRRLPIWIMIIGVLLFSAQKFAAAKSRVPAAAPVRE
jgi:hypothetical protein